MSVLAILVSRLFLFGDCHLYSTAFQTGNCDFVVDLELDIQVFVLRVWSIHCPGQD